MTDIQKTDYGYQILYTDASGSEKTVSAKAVIITAGGYMNDDTLMKETGRGFYLNENVGAVNSIPLTGDGVRLARKLGAVPDGMELMLTSYCDGDRFPRNAETQRLWDLMMFSFPYLWVNKEGERFVNEGLMNGCYLANAIANQTDGTYYMILDHATKEKIRTEGPGYLGIFIQ